MTTKKQGFASSERTHAFIQISFILFFIWILAKLAVVLSPVLIPVLISFFLAYFLNPFVTYLKKHKIPRTLGIVILLLIVVFIVSVFVIFVVPLLAEQLKDFINKIPTYTKHVKEWLVPWIEKTFNTELPNLKQATERLTDTISKDVMSLAGEAYSPLKQLAGFAAAGTFFLFSLITTIFIIPFFTFFLLRDFDKISKLPQKLVPPRHWKWTESVIKDLDATLSSWLHGQIIVMIILGTLYSIGYTFVGVTLSLFIGMLTGFLAFIPYVGAFTGFLLALIMASLDASFREVMGVIIVFGGVQMLDAFFITPNILGKSIGINPALVVFSLMTFALLWGFWGALIAVPLAAIINVIIRHIYAKYITSDFFKGHVSN